MGHGLLEYIFQGRRCLIRAVASEALALICADRYSL
jgi:hypothetical protein